MAWPVNMCYTKDANCDEVTVNVTDAPHLQKRTRCTRCIN
jgi:hypothetical protein